MNSRYVGWGRCWLLLAVVAGLGSAGSAPAAAGPTSVLVQVKGTVGASPEFVAFEGPVRIDSRTVTDPQFGAAPSVELSIDMSALTGVGLSSKRRYETSSREVISAPLRLDTGVDVGVEFAYAGTGNAAASTFGVGRVNLRLIFVGAAGALSTGRGWIDTPGARSAARP